LQLDDFLRYAKQGTMVPVYRELLADTLTPVTAFLRLRRLNEPAFLLESVEGGERVGRYSFLGRQPREKITAKGDEVILERGGKSERLTGGFFKALDQHLRPLRTVSVPGLPPLTGGAVGYVGYDGVRWIEKLPDRHSRETSLADAEFQFYDTLVAFDHPKHRLYLISNVSIPETGKKTRAELESAFAGAQEKIDELEEALSRPLPEEECPQNLEALAPESLEVGMSSNFTREEFESAVKRAKDYISAGDAFQIVLSQRFQRELTVDPFDVYRSLRALNPSPYLFYLQWEDSALLGSSPETMVRVEGRKAMVRPIAGTRPRGVDEATDCALQEELLADQKELAEHRMLVDLGRNDIGRVAKFGTVNLSRLEEVERYSHVMHIVSEVEGDLSDELTAVDAFCAGFPAGTVSGAPKIRAMEIIDELEPSRRSTYAGAVGYVDFAGNLDTCIAIRTLLIHKGMASLQAGAGIVADSVPEREYFETIHKASALYEAIRMTEARRRGPTAK
jgi:anthranilate synthase component 1